MSLHLLNAKQIFYCIKKKNPRAFLKNNVVPPLFFNLIFNEEKNVDTVRDRMRTEVSRSPNQTWWSSRSFSHKSFCCPITDLHSIFWNFLISQDVCQKNITMDHFKYESFCPSACETTRITCRYVRNIRKLFISRIHLLWHFFFFGAWMSELLQSSSVITETWNICCLSTEDWCKHLNTKGPPAASILRKLMNISCQSETRPSDRRRSHIAFFFSFTWGTVWRLKAEAWADKVPL